MDYKFESYLTEICDQCNKLTGRNYTYKRRKHQASIYWFENGVKKEYNMDVQFYYGPMHMTAKEVAEMVVR